MSGRKKIVGKINSDFKLNLHVDLLEKNNGNSHLVVSKIITDKLKSTGLLVKNNSSFVSNPSIKCLLPHSISELQIILNFSGGPLL